MMLSQYFSFIFDVAGLYHFKSRFRPRFEDRFICAVRPSRWGPRVPSSACAAPFG